MSASPQAGQPVADRELNACRVEVAMVSSPDSAREQAYLVSRGVRPMAYLGACRDTAESRAKANGLLLTAGQNFDGVIPFVIARRDGFLEYGFAAEAWIVELYRWVIRDAPDERRAALTGLLLGYGPHAIARHLGTAQARAGEGVLL